MRHLKRISELGFDTTHYSCDAEIGKPGHWHGCNRKAVIGIAVRTGELHYCSRHADHASDHSGMYFEHVPFAEPRKLEV